MPRCFVKIVSIYLLLDHFWGFLHSVIKVGLVHCRMSIEFWEKNVRGFFSFLFLFWLVMLSKNRNFSHYSVLETSRSGGFIMSKQVSFSGWAVWKFPWSEFGLQCMIFGVKYRVCYTWFNNIRTSIKDFCLECLKYGEVILRRGRVFG